MRSRLYSSKVSRLQREIERLRRDLAKATKDIASKSKRISQIQGSVSEHTSAASLRSKQRSIERLQKQVVRLQEKAAVLNKKIADKTSQLHKAQGKLSASRAKDQENLIQSIRESQEASRRALSQEIAQIKESIPGRRMPGEVGLAEPEYDAFISYAHEDKDELVRALAEALQDRGVSVWYDEFELCVGDSLRRSIDKGLARSRFGVVVLSPSFFAKNWTQYELDGLVAREMLGNKVILPIWHKVTKNEVMEYSPSLADRVALSTTQYTISEIADGLSGAVGGT